jgi:hypothetical protein
VTQGHVLRVSGWAYGPGEGWPQVRVWSGNSIVATSTMTRRPDVASAFPGAPEECGFDVKVLGLGLGDKFRFSLTAQTSGGDDLPLAQVWGRRTLVSLGEPDSGRPLPLLVTGLGRTGTSWVQHLLGTHPQLLTEPRWPHELSAISFWIKTLRRLVDSPYGLDGWKANPPTSWWLRDSPYLMPEMQAWRDNARIEVIARFARDGIASVHRALAQDGPLPEFVAEKARLDADTDLVRELFPAAREIVLVRDFRDMLASILAFNSKRGSDGFGRDLVESDEAYVRRLTRSVRALHDRVVSHPDVLVVRFEDLMTDQTRTIERILRFLGVSSKNDVVATMIHQSAIDSDEMRFHRTTESAGDSIGRWRRDLPTELADLASAEWAPVLAAFGYA